MAGPGTSGSQRTSYSSGSREAASLQWCRNLWPRSVQKVHGGVKGVIPNEPFASAVAWPRVRGRCKINAKLHDGVCQHCKGILEWRVKFSKYKLLSKPKKCVKCLQKTVKDPYHIICRPCAGKLEVCAKCGKEEEIVIPIDKGQDKTESVTTENGQESSGLEDELDFHRNFSSTDSDEDSDVLEEQFKSMNFERTEI
ncbi:PREDICTED: uncharacterized protein C9orf85 homolog [Chlamydotis macqueenii]|uniref:uncharacterized protein C9orf85 homolog n=1 Tax=Chlamydotis macqueenii TaxID=187382 RepID=UPI000529DF80|nr:PREDICTED: uncharacterized protein C9orf85 homolog [Chlamydotis macqueenii]